MQRRSFSAVDKAGAPKPRRALSQNFLIDQNIARKIVNALSVEEGDRVLEIGAGTGALTRHLVSTPGTIYAVEKDRRLWTQLQQEFPKVNIFGTDFLKLDLQTMLVMYSATEKEAIEVISGTLPLEDSTCFKVVGNLPYHLTTKIILHLIKYRRAVSGAVLMVQKEYAERMAAHPGGKAYGSLTVLLSYYGKVEKLFGVSRNCFRPKPKVDSTVVRIQFHSLPRAHPRDEEFLFKIVRGSFGKRRKTLANALSSSLKVKKEFVEKGMEETGISPSRRGESLSLEEFVKLSNSLRARSS